MAALREEYRNGPLYGLPVWSGNPAPLPSLVERPVLVDEHTERLDAISLRLTQESMTPDPVAQQTPLHHDAHTSLANVWASRVSERREMHHGVLWKMAVVKFGEEGARAFWDDLTQGDAPTRQTAIHALAPHAVEFASLTHQVEGRVSKSASNPLSAFWQSRTFRAEAGDLAPLLYGYEEHERAVAHHRQLVSRQRRQVSLAA